MVANILQLLTDVSFLGIISFLTHQTMVRIFDMVTDPLIRLFYEHMKAWAKKKGHPKRNALRCPDCAPIMKDLPN